MNIMQKLYDKIHFLNEVHGFFYKQKLYKQRQAEIGKKSSRC